MTEHEARQHLTEMLEHFTVGSVLHLLADLHRQWAIEDDHQAADAADGEGLHVLEHALLVVGLGLDAVRRT